jgi:hypothetical protein
MNPSSSFVDLVDIEIEIREDVKSPIRLYGPFHS